jgi:hypothetical protein
MIKDWVSLNGDHCEVEKDRTQMDDAVPSHVLVHGAFNFETIYIVSQIKCLIKQRTCERRLFKTVLVVIDVM